MNEPKQNDLIVILMPEQAQFLLVVLDDATIKGRHARLLCATRDAISGARSFTQLLPKSPLPTSFPEKVIKPEDTISDTL